MLDFRPPMDSTLLIGLVKMFMPLYMKLGLGDTSISVSPDAVQRFNKLKGKRALICPNHSNRHDPQVMFAFSKEVGEDFNFIAAREVFDWNHGLNGWMLQKCGAYSVVRGAVDRESFKTTKDILAKGRKKLVLFPEGEITKQNDSLLPLESGAAQLSFMALNDIKKASFSETLYIVPMALKYTYPDDVTSNLREMVFEMERKLGIPENTDKLNVRVRNIAEKLLGILEREYRESSSKNASMNERVTKLRRVILQRVGSRLEVELQKGMRELEHVRVLRNKIDDFLYSHGENGGSEYENRIHGDIANTYRACYKDLDRVVNFISIYDGYLSEHMTQERCADVIDRLEIEIMGRAPTLRGARKVLIEVGEPIDLHDYYESYKNSKKETIEKVTDNIFGQISSMLQALDSNRKAIILN